MKKGLFIIFLFIIILLALSNEWSILVNNNNDETLLAKDYTPHKPMIKVFGSFDENVWKADIVDVVTDNKIQVRKINNDLNQLHIYEIEENEINLVYLDFKVDLFAESYLNEKPHMKFTFLKGPIKEGTKWKGENHLFEITDINSKVKTSAGVFDAIEVSCRKDTDKSKEHPSMKQYFAKDIGIVKSIFTNSNSSLELVKIDYNPNKLKGLDDVFNFLEEVKTELEY